MPLLFLLDCVDLDLVDFRLYPHREYQLWWLRSFLEFSYEETGRSASCVTDLDIERLYVQVNKFSLVGELVGIFGVFLNLHNFVLILNSQM